jgi:hypothetical protein
MGRALRKCSDDRVEPAQPIKTDFILGVVDGLQRRETRPLSPDVRALVDTVPDTVRRRAGGVGVVMLFIAVVRTFMLGLVYRYVSYYDPPRRA